MTRLFLNQYTYYIVIVGIFLCSVGLFVLACIVIRSFFKYIVSQLLLGGCHVVIKCASVKPFTYIGDVKNKDCRALVADWMGNQDEEGAILHYINNHNMRIGSLRSEMLDESQLGQGITIDSIKKIELGDAIEEQVSMPQGMTCL